MATEELVTLAVVSDSHLSPKTPEAAANWAALVRHIEVTKPDAVVHTGDIALDGTTDEDDLRYAKERLDELPVPVYPLPGNHDLGDNPCETNGESDHLITDDRLAAYRRHVGDDRWTFDLGTWRLIGANAQLFGSGLGAEDDQWRWLETQLADSGRDRHQAFFLHKPLLHSLPHPAEHDLPIRYVRPAARERLMAMLDAAAVRLVVSGHVHQHHRHRTGDLDHVWAPTSWATLAESMQATIGERWVGSLDLTLRADGSYHVEPVLPPDVGQHVIGQTVPNPYH